MSLFGKFNLLVDELVHIFLSLFISLCASYLGVSDLGVSFIFLSGLLIDIDHLFNPWIAKSIGLSSYKGFAYGNNGFTFKILHGFDVFLLVSIAVFWLTQDSLLSSFLFLNLMMHHLWDFVVYPHNPKELFLISRLKCDFKPGIRNYWVGLFFDLKSLKY